MSERLQYMANQIARNLRRGHGDPVEAVAAHLNGFWSVKMRAELLAHLNVSADGYDAEVIAARDLIRGKAQTG